jgi:membrane protein
VTRSDGLWRFDGLTVQQLVRNLVVASRENNFSGRASELAFNFLLALFPLILFILELFGLFASRSLELRNYFLLYVADFVPPVAFQLLKKTTAELAANASSQRLAFGVLLTVWLASRGVSSMISALNLAYGVREARSWMRVRMAAVALTIAISILMLVALLLVLVSSHSVEWIGRELRLRPLILAMWPIIRWTAAAFFLIVSYSLIYLAGPEWKQRHWRWITPGSAFGAIIWLTASAVFKIYLVFFNHYSIYYGSLGAVMILLLWLYAAALAFLIGGEINAQIDRARLVYKRRI